MTLHIIVLGSHYIHMFFQLLASSAGDSKLDTYNIYKNVTKPIKNYDLTILLISNHSGRLYKIILTCILGSKDSVSSSCSLVRRLILELEALPF